MLPIKICVFSYGYSNVVQKIQGKAKFVLEPGTLTFWGKSTTFSEKKNFFGGSLTHR